MNKAVMLSVSPMSLMRGMEQFILSGVLPNIKRVEWLEEDKSCTNGHTIKLPRPFVGMTDTDLALWRYKCQHEIGHECPVNASPHWKTVMEKEIKTHKSKILWSIVNLLSDFSQERNQLGQYYGRDGIILHGRKLFFEHMLFPKLDTSQKFGQLFVHDFNERNKWNSHLKGLVAPMADNGFLSDVASKGSWLDLRNDQDCFDLGLRIFELFEEEAEKEAEAQAQQEKDEKAMSDAMKEIMEQIEKFASSMVGEGHGVIQKPTTDDDEESTPAPHTTISDDGTRTDVSKARRIVPRTPVNLAWAKKRW